MGDTTTAKKSAGSDPPRALKDILSNGEMAHAKKRASTESHAAGGAGEIGGALHALSEMGVLGHVPGNALLALPGMIEQAHDGNWGALALSVAEAAANSGPIGWTLGALRFQFEGLCAIGKAHEKGKADASAMIYANAWVDTILEGMPRQSTLRENIPTQEAAWRDAVATKTPEFLADLEKLKASLGGEVRRTLLVELYARAGFEGLR